MDLNEIGVASTALAIIWAVLLAVLGSPPTARLFVR